MTSDRDEPNAKGQSDGRGTSRPRKKRRPKNDRWPSLPGPSDLRVSQGEDAKSARSSRAKKSQAASAKRQSQSAPRQERRQQQGARAQANQAGRNAKGQQRRPLAKQQPAGRTSAQGRRRGSDDSRTVDVRRKRPQQGERTDRPRQKSREDINQRRRENRQPGRTSPTPTNRSKAAQARARAKARVKTEQKARTRRRIIIFAAMVMGIILLAVAALYLLNGRGSSAAVQEEDPVEKWAPVACDASSLDAELEIPDSKPAGSDVALTVNLHNTSDAKPCYVDVGWDNTEISITSGSDQIFSSRTCEVGDEYKQLLLDRNMETSFALSWPGGRGCDTSDLAQAGTYKATLTFTDKAADKETAVFVLE